MEASDCFYVLGKSTPPCTSNSSIHHPKRAHPDLNQGPADLQSAALTTELCTHCEPKLMPPLISNLANIVCTSFMCRETSLRNPRQPTWHRNMCGHCIPGSAGPGRAPGHGHMRGLSGKQGSYRTHCKDKRPSRAPNGIAPAVILISLGVTYDDDRRK